MRSATFLNKVTGIKVTVVRKNQNETFIFGLGGIKLVEGGFEHTCFTVKKMGFHVTED